MGFTKISNDILRKLGDWARKRGITRTELINLILKNLKEEDVDALLENALKQGMITEKPNIPLGKAQLVLEKYDSKKIKDNLSKYLLLRKLRRAQYGKRNEFRRHVTMSAMVDGKLIEVNIDNILSE